MLSSSLDAFLMVFDSTVLFCFLLFSIVQNFVSLVLFQMFSSLGQVRRRRSSSSDEDGDDVEVSWRGRGSTRCCRFPRGSPFRRGRGSAARLFPLTRVVPPARRGRPVGRRGPPTGRVAADSASLILGTPRIASVLPSLARVPSAAGPALPPVVPVAPLGVPVLPAGASVPPSVELVLPSVAPDPPVVEPALSSLGLVLSAEVPPRPPSYVFIVGKMSGTKSVISFKRKRVVSSRNDDNEAVFLARNDPRVEGE